MKKKFIAFTIAGTLAAISITGCGNTETPLESNESTSVPENTDISPDESSESDTESSPEEIESSAEESETSSGETPSSAEESEISSGETPSSAEESENEEPSAEDVIPVTDEWAVNLYNALLKDDYNTVMAILVDIPTVRENCAPYEDTAWAVWDYETAYKMTMSDGQIMGIVIYESEDSPWEINAFVSYQYGDGFEFVGYGDHCVSMHPNGAYSYITNGNEVISADPGMAGFTMDENDVWIVWHV